MGLVGGNDEVGGNIVAHQLSRRELWKQGCAARQERGGWRRDESG